VAYTYDAGSTTPGYEGLIECNGVRVNSALPSGANVGGTFKLEDNPLLGTAPVRLPTSDLPADHGASIGTALLSGWPLTFGGWLWVPTGPDDVPAAQEQLKAAFSALNGQLLITANARSWATKRQITAQLNGQVVFSARHGTLRIPTRNFTLPMLAPDPLMYDADNLRTLDVPMTGAATPVTNAGNAPTYMVARFVGPFTTSAQLTRTTDTKVIVYNLSLAAAAYIDVDTHAIPGPSAVTNTGANAFGDISFWTLFTIPPGTTNFTATATSGTTGASKVTLTWRDAWA
jgi:hypothetical protein